jgi:hypothetical protein
MANGSWAMSYSMITPKRYFFDDFDVMELKGVEAFNVQAVKLVVRVIFPQLRTFKILHLDPYSTAIQTLERIIEKTDLNTHYNIENHAIYVTPAEHDKKTFYGFWLPDEGTLAAYEVTDRVRNFTFNSKVISSVAFILCQKNGKSLYYSIEFQR